jgi:hypothetical protein
VTSAVKTTKIRFSGTPEASGLILPAHDFKYLQGEIRYLADQWNFTVEQRIENAVTIELQWKFGCFPKIANDANKCSRDPL